MDRGWKKVGDFSNPTKFKAFTLIVLGQLLLSRSRHHVSEVLCIILSQLSKGKTLAPMIYTETISSLFHCAQLCNGQLYGCSTFLQVWLRKYISSLPSSIPRQVTLIQAPLGKMTTIDYQGLFVGLLYEHITWQAKWYREHYRHLFLGDHTYMILIGLY